VSLITGQLRKIRNDPNVIFRGLGEELVTLSFTSFLLVFVDLAPAVIYAKSHVACFIETAPNLWYPESLGVPLGTVIGFA
jgi:hypothetical protein